MKKYLPLITSLMLFPTQFIPVSKILTTNKSPSHPVSQSPRQSYVATVKKNSINPPPAIAVETQIIASEIAPEFKQYAREISVKIDSENNGGSGVIIGKKDDEYLVLTNNHVIQGEEDFTIQTADKKIHQGKIVSQPILEDDDIALLTFSSNRLYQVANLNGAAKGKVSQQILAVGYSAAEGIFKMEEGTIKRIPNQPLKEGYQIGYDSNIVSGMSGGAILNIFGDVIGINGKSAFPILNTGYVYQDGRIPSREEIEELRQLSWGLSVNQLLIELKPEIMSAYGLPLPATNTITNPDLPGWVGKLEAKAKQITVKINSSSGSNGSGIIVAKENNTYAVLTADHVICEKDEETRKCIGYTYEIVTPDGKKYTLNPKDFKRQEGVDLAVVRFKSQEKYEIAQLADYPVTKDDEVFVAGYPKLNNQSQWQFGLGYGLEREQGLLSINDDSLSIESGSSLGLSIRQDSLIGGYEMVYTSITHGGMSGGAVLDREGRVIGIHGLAEGETAFDSQSSSQKQIQLGYSLGIPVKTFIGLADRFKVESKLTIENKRPRELNDKEAETFKTAILDTDIAKGNAIPEIWLERGNQLWRLKRYNEAIEAFDRAIALNPDFVYLAYYGKGVALWYQYEDEAALTNFDQAAKAQGDFAPAFSYKSLVLSELNRKKEALIAINQAITLEPNNANFYHEKANILLYLERYSEAEIASNQAFQLSPRSIFYNSLALIHYEQEQYELALANSNKAIQLNPGNALAYVNRGRIYDEKKQYDLALADFNKSIELNPKFAWAYDIRGIFYQEKKQEDLALADFNKSIELNPEDDSTYVLRGNIYHNKKQEDLALADYNKAIELNPENDSIYMIRGFFYDKKKQEDLALTDFNKSIELNPKNAFAYVFRGNFYKEKKQYDLALADYNKAIELKPENDFAYSSRGNLYKEKKQDDLALADYNKAIELKPENDWTYVFRGNLYYNKKQYDLALADFNKAIQLNPEDYSTYVVRGDIYKNKKQEGLALADYNKAIQLNPKNALAYVNRGLFYKEKKQEDLALADFNKAIQLNTKNPWVYVFRGDFYKKKKQDDLALAEFNKAIELNPENNSLYVSRGNFYKEKKQDDLALADFNKAIELNPGNAFAYISRGNLYQEKKQDDLALADFNKGIELNPEDPLAYVIRGEFYKEKKQEDLALADFNKAIELNPKDANAYLQRGLAYHRQKKWQQALRDYGQTSLSENLVAVANIGLIAYEKGDLTTARKQFEKVLGINNKSAEIQLALAITLFTQGDVESGLSLAETVLKLEQKWSEVNTLQENLWGEKIIADTQKLLSHPRIQALLAKS